MFMLMYIFSIFTHAENYLMEVIIITWVVQSFIIVILLYEWASGILLQQKENFLDYCLVKIKDVTMLDSFQIVMMAHYMVRNITLIFGVRDHWSTEQGMVDNIVLIYIGENKFIQTEGTYNF